MTIAKLEQIFTDQQAFRQLTESIRPGSTVQLASLVGSSLSLVAHGAIARLGGVHVLVAEDRDAAGYLYNDLYPLTGGEGLFFFPTGYKRSIQYGQEDPSGLVQRTTALNALRSAADKPLILCTYPEALTEKVADRERLSDSVLKLRRGDNLSTAFVEEALRECRFERVEFVYEPGQYSVRGGIVDIFSYSDNKPYRIDFFGDEIDSIRPFDVGTQLSTGTLDEVEIVPNLKTVTSVEHRVSLARFAGEVTYWIADGDYTLKRFDDIRTKILGDLDEPSSIDTLVTSRKGFLSDAKKAAFVLLRDNVRERPAEVRVAFDTTPQPEFNKKFDLLADDINANRLRGYSTCLLSDNKAQIERLSNIFNSIGEKNVVFDSVPLALHAGFVDHTSKNCFYTDHQIFDRYQRYRIRGELDRSESLTIQELNSLKVGDYVVHIDHGVGRFGGLTRTIENGKVHEAIKLVYRDNDVLLVNVHALHRISKYKDKDSEPPKIYKLGSGAWQHMKLNTKKAVKDIARELIALYAKRQASRGFAFSPDSYMQHELEASFIYEDTPDQQTATQLVKQDMESPVPMDRLVCGDVGFGKTEVALRAAFAVAMAGAQVALIVPTTLLARQHYYNFKQRMAGFPLNVRMLSRLQTPAEARKVKEGLKDGAVDIVIGTHALLANNIEFANLGLLIIDEEQHFGVAHKEKLKNLKADVHVLTLTATPIPRTLQMSLTGVKQLSIIATPPVDRLAARTFVMPFDGVMIKEAIYREKFRGGQTFVVCPRVSDIARVHDVLQELAPDAKILVAHGQMPVKQLEEVMNDFADRKGDILLSTTIIESGIDMPSVNTMIVYRADMFGLAQLYQLRGRIGRSKVRGYCYFTVPAQKNLKPIAERRLSILQALDSLGAGFSLASHDMDIRGSGNILGEEQSGHIKEVGIALYHHMLEEEIARIKAGAAAAETDGKAAADWSPQIVTGVPIMIPESYVRDLGVRLGLYKRIGGLETPEALLDMREELVDRFGPVPPEVENLLKTVEIKQLCRAANIEKVDAGAKGFLVAFHNNVFRSPEKLVELVARSFGKIKVRPDQKLLIEGDLSSYAVRLETIKSWIGKINRL